MLITLVIEAFSAESQEMKMSELQNTKNTTMNCSNLIIQSMNESDLICLCLCCINLFVTALYANLSFRNKHAFLSKYVAWIFCFQHLKKYQ